MKTILGLSQEAVKDINLRNASEQHLNAWKDVKRSSEELELAVDNIIDGEIEQLQLSELKL